MSQQSTHLAAELPAIATDLVIRERITPAPGADEILIRNHTIAINPIDWKRQAWGFAIPSYPVILGSDVCGTVAEVGSSVADFKVGDRVIGYADSFQSGNDDHAAFQEYTVVKSITAAQLPDSISFEQGALLPMAVGTSAVALFGVLGLPRPSIRQSPSVSSSILIWGGSGSVGSIAIQLAKLAGYKVIATASKQHHAYLRSLGASELVDYHSPSVVDDIIAAAKRVGSPITHAVDTISEGSTFQSVTEVLLRSAEQGQETPKVAHLLPLPETVPKPDGITAEPVHGEEIWTSRVDLAEWLFNDFLSTALEKEVVVPSPAVEVVEGGLNGLQPAMNTLKAGVSGKKLIVKLK
ncbi:chaperonin 10-like protein [Xylogone sp. PMI_703]|nr:chaperonin 10-like protein [Xylogone sp. PMI_703]